MFGLNTLRWYRNGKKIEKIRSHAWIEAGYPVDMSLHKEYWQLPASERKRVEDIAEVNIKKAGLDKWRGLL